MGFINQLITGGHHPVGFTVLLVCWNRSLSVSTFFLTCQGTQRVGELWQVQQYQLGVGALNPVALEHDTGLVFSYGIFLVGSGWYFHSNYI